MNKTPFIIILLTFLAFLMLDVWMSEHVISTCNDACAQSYESGRRSVIDSLENGLLDATFDDLDSVIVVHYYYDKKVNPNP